MDRRDPNPPRTTEREKARLQKLASCALLGRKSELPLPMGKAAGQSSASKGEPESRSTPKASARISRAFAPDEGKLI